MFRPILSPLFVAALASLPATAQTTVVTSTGPGSGDARTVEVSTLIDHEIYIERADSAATGVDLSELTDVPPHWQRAGNVRDAILTTSGRIDGIVIDAGGFLGKGAVRRVPLSEIRFMPDADDEGQYFLLFEGNRQAFENTDEYDAQTVDLRLGEQTINGETAEPVRIETLNTDDMIGMAVFGQNNNWVGEIGTFTMTEDERIESVIFEIGGFLGIGETQVALPIDQVQFRRLGGDEMRAYVSATEEELGNMESWTPE